MSAARHERQAGSWRMISSYRSACGNVGAGKRTPRPKTVPADWAYDEGYASRT